MTAAVEVYAALIETFNAQRERTQGGNLPQDTWGGAMARRFRADPRRELDSNSEVIASYVQPDDVLVDVGGGAGRLGLPLALRCREVINVDPSPGMRAEFEAASSEAGITNARFIQENWLESNGVQGDLTVAANVTYFVRDIGTFIDKLVQASRRRVIISVFSVPTPYTYAKLFRLVYGEEMGLVPGHTHLLPVLWEMGILPDVRVLPGVPTVGGGPVPPSLPQTREEALQAAVSGGIWLGSNDLQRAYDILDEHFYEVFSKRDDGFVPLWSQQIHQLLITWETGS